MKNLLKMSLIAIFAAVPGLSFAAAGDVDKDPGATTASAPVAQNAPRYALATADSATDNNAASAGYVKGAYNAAIKAINKVSDTANSAATKANALSSTFETMVMPAMNSMYTDVEANKAAISALQSASSNAATQSGVVETIKDVTLAQGAVTQGITGDVSGTTSTILTIMTEWGATTSSAVSALTSVSKGTLNTNVSVAAPNINAASVAYTEQ